MTRPRLILGAVLLLALAGGALVVAGLDRGDPALERRLRATGLTLHLPDLRGAEVRRTRVEGGAVASSLERSGTFIATLRQVPAPADGDLCRLLQEDGCQARGGVARADFEEQTQVAVRRGGTVLMLIGLVIEQDPTVADEAIAALQDAPVVSPRALTER